MTRTKVIDVKTAVLITLFCLLCSFRGHGQEQEPVKVDPQLQQKEEFASEKSLEKFLGPFAGWMKFKSKPFGIPRSDVEDPDWLFTPPEGNGNGILNSFPNSIPPLKGPGIGPLLPDPGMTVFSSDFEEEYLVMLYEDKGGASSNGDAIEIRIVVFEEDGEYYLELTYAQDRWDNCISSFETNSNHPADWWVFDSTYCRNLLDSGSGSRSNCNGYNDRISSFRVKCPDGSHYYTSFYIFEDEDYEDDCLPFKFYKYGKSDDTVLEISCLSKWNDRISSIDTYGQNCRHYEWHFYKDKNYNSGGSANLVLEDGEDDSNLSDNGLNDRITSIRLYIEEE
ncbi:MAG: hypothetical protein ACYTG7_26555 [Planctomycetota bacterium]|jgi:hypothetical protein